MTKFLALIFIGLFATLTEASDAKLSSISETVGKLRALTLKKPVASATKTPAEIETYIRRRISEEYATGELEREKRVLVLFGLIPQSFPYEQFVVELLREQIGAYFEPKDGKLYISEKLPQEAYDQVVAHEVVHAIQAQHFPLEKLMKRDRTNDDRTMAINALIEGDATEVMLLYQFKGVEVPAAAVQQVRAEFRKQLGAGQALDSKFSTSPAFLKDSLVFPYAEGLGFVGAVRDQKGWGAVDKIYTELPDSTEQILHPEKFIAKEKPFEIKESDLNLSSGFGFEIETSNVLGELGWRSVFAKKKGAISAVAAEGWGGDQYWLLRENSSKKESLVVFTSWDTAKDADEAEKAWRASGLGPIDRKDMKAVMGVGLSVAQLEKLGKSWLAKP